MPLTVYGFFQNGGARCYVLSVKTIPKAQAALLNAEGKPQLLVQAKQAGFDGLRLRVKVDAPQIAAPATGKKADKSKEGEGQPATEPQAMAGPGPLPSRSSTKSRPAAGRPKKCCGMSR